MQVSRPEKYQQMRKLLNAKQWRQYLALETKEGRKIEEVAREAAVSPNTIRGGIKEVEAGDLATAGGRIRQAGGGRKTVVEIEATLLSDLEGLLDPKGDPMSLLKWTTKSVAHLKEALQEKGHQIADTAVRGLLRSLGYWLRANKKTIEGKSPPHRDAQFQHIATKCKEFEQKGHPSISVDCKKKELLGNFKNNGREWQAKGEETRVNVYDFVSLADGKAIPYGVYDLVHKRGFVNVGIDHETAQFAVESIPRWWQHCGKALYRGKKELLIRADGGGSKGARNRLWKKKLQELANEHQVTISVVHYPPATSKWNKIEHRLFSFISSTWRAKPLISLEVVLELLSATTTDAGLTVTALKDSNTDPPGLKVTDEELAALHLVPDSFHGAWNYTLHPQLSAAEVQVI